MSANQALAAVVAERLHNALTARGVVLRANDGQLCYEAPRGALSPELLEALRAHKREFLALLAPVDKSATAHSTAPSDADLQAAFLAAERAYGDLYPIWTAKHDELIAAHAAGSADEPRLKQELAALLNENHRLRAAYGAAEGALSTVPQRCT